MFYYFRIIPLCIWSSSLSIIYHGNYKFVSSTRYEWYFLCLSSSNIVRLIFTGKTKIIFFSFVFVCFLLASCFVPTSVSVCSLGDLNVLQETQKQFYRR